MEANVPITDLVELQSRLIYSIIVAGKSAKFTEGVMRRFEAHRLEHSPFDFIKILIDEENLDWVLRDIRSGNYSKLEKALRALVADDGLDLATCTPERLETVHGIGPKTSRFFILWTRPDAEHAALDIHVLRWLHANGYDAPKTTPTGAKYAELEKIFLNEARNRGMTPRELDAAIWEQGSNKGQRELIPS